jgi:uncharacterized HAD superfamily protein
LLDYRFASERYHLPHIQDIHPKELEEFMEKRRFRISKNELTDVMRSEVAAIVTQSKERAAMGSLEPKTGSLTKTPIFPVRLRS